MFPTFGNAAPRVPPRTSSDDNNAVIDDAKNPTDAEAPGFEPGWPASDDIRLSLTDLAGEDWIATLALPAVPESGRRSGFYIEDEAINAGDVVDNGQLEIPDEKPLRMSTYGAKDWGAPGKMHMELNYWEANE